MSETQHPPRSRVCSRCGLVTAGPVKDTEHSALCRTPLLLHPGAVPTVPSPLCRTPAPSLWCRPHCPFTPVPPTCLSWCRSPTSTSSLTLDTIRADSDGPPEAHRLQQQYEPQTNSDRDVRSFQRVLLRSTTVAGRRGRAREGLGIESSSAGRSGLEGAPDGKGTGGQLEGRSHGGWEDDLGLRRAQAPGREGAPPPAEDGGVPVPGEGCMPRDEGTRPDSARQGRQERRRPLFEET